jgi:hypothetical protein
MMALARAQTPAAPPEQFFSKSAHSAKFPLLPLKPDIRE